MVCESVLTDRHGAGAVGDLDLVSDRQRDADATEDHCVEGDETAVA